MKDRKPYSYIKTLVERANTTNITLLAYFNIVWRTNIKSYTVVIHKK